MAIAGRPPRAPARAQSNRSHDLSRRALLGSIGAASGARFAPPAAAQPDAPPPAAPAPPTFGYQDIVKRARDLAAAPFDNAIPPLPDGLATLDFDGWRGKIGR